MKSPWNALRDRRRAARGRLKAARAAKPKKNDGRLRRKRCAWCGRPRGARWKLPCPSHGRSGPPPKRTQAELKRLWDSQRHYARYAPDPPRAPPPPPPRPRPTSSRQGAAAAPPPVVPPRVYRLIQSLQRLMASPNKHEAALAKQRLDELLKKYNLRLTNKA